MQKRESGILLHVSSLPSSYGIGDLGKEAYFLIDFLFHAGQSLWQVLPLNPVNPICGNSPYSSISAFAANPLFISPDLLLEDGFLHLSDIEPGFQAVNNRVDYNTVISCKENLFTKAHGRFIKKKNRHYEKFCVDQAYWLDDYALFVALKDHFGGKLWTSWPKDLRDRKKNALAKARRDFSDKISREKFLQFIFYKQWSNLKSYAQEKNISIVGDIPIYVTHDSADVWAHPHIFKLDKNKNPTVVAGVPPDYFSATGQLWGNPVYQWNELKKEKYAWWVDRIRYNLDFFDYLRIDHFRGLVGYWQVPVTETTAVNGEWAKVPAKDFFDTLLKHFPHCPIVAEDLGVMTEDVHEIMRLFGLPGMKILLFAFGDNLAKNPYVPHNHVSNCVVYTGTHDNNTARGWFEHEASQQTKQQLFHYFGREFTLYQIHWELMRVAMMSVADTVIFPMQDVLGLGSEARMNIPGTPSGNWEWRLLPGQAHLSLAKALRMMTETYGRI